MIECNCGAKFQEKQIPCPDGREGCLVLHYNKDSWVCSNCGKNWALEIASAIREGRVKTETVTFFHNPKSVTKIDPK